MPLCMVLMEWLIHFQKCMNYLPRFMKFWTMMSSILAYLYHFASKLCHEVWAFHFPFLHNFKDTVPPSEACLYVHITSLWLRFSNNFPWHVPVVGTWQKDLSYTLGLKSYQGGRKPSGNASASSMGSRKKGSHVGSHS